MRISKFVLLVFCLVCASTQLSAQNEILKIADTYFANEIYQKAAKYYLSAGKEASASDVQYKLAVCYYETNDIPAAKNLFGKLYKEQYKNRKVSYYIAKISHNEWEFEKAISHYKAYLRKLPSGHDDRKMIIGLIKRCANGLKLKYEPQRSFIENMGPQINTDKDEFGVVQSKNDPERFYLTSNREGSTGGKRNKKGLKDEAYGHCFADMFVVDGKEGIWGDVKSLGELINSPQNDIIHGFNQDGSVMYFSKGYTYDETEILVDTFKVTRSAEDYPSSFLAKIKGSLGDKYLNIYNDSTILFSSKRKGGYGGYDIYVTQKRSGRWTEPSNLGANINTPYDEISPFLSNDGRKLFYSSNNEKSIGGFDVFQSSFLPEQSDWSPAENIGMPVNSGNDDTDYMVTQGGKSALFTSNRKEGYGGKDIYISYLKEIETSQLATGVAEVLFVPDHIGADTSTRIDVAMTESLPTENKEPIKIREYIITPLYYGDDERLITPNNKRQLDRILEMMQVYPAIQIELTCNTAEEGINAYELYFSVKRAEKVIDYLKKNNVDLNRVHVKGLGNNYPLAKEIKSGGSLKLSQLNNRRIDIIVHDAEGLPLKLSFDYPDLPQDLQDYKFEEYKSSIQGLSYKVEIAKVNQLYQNDILSNYNDATIEKNLLDNSYQYTLGLYNRYNTVRVLKDQLVNGEFKNAKVIPYINGLRIERSMLTEHAKDYPDLLKYIAGEIQVKE